MASRCKNCNIWFHNARDRDAHKPICDQGRDILDTLKGRAFTSTTDAYGIKARNLFVFPTDAKVCVVKGVAHSTAIVIQGNGVFTETLVQLPPFSQIGKEIVGVTIKAATNKDLQDAIEEYNQTVRAKIRDALTPKTS